MNELVVKMIALLAGVAAAAGIWGLTRFGKREPMSEQQFEELWNRHKTTYWMTYPACFAGILFALGMYRYGGYLNTGWRPGGIGMGLIIALPMAVVAIRTLPKGTEFHAEFWRSISTGIRSAPWALPWSTAHSSPWD